MGICKNMKQDRSITDFYADRIFRDAPVYTADMRRPWAEAIAVREGRIVYVGDASGLLPFIGPDTEIVSLPHGLILPAFRDGHIHPLTGSLAFLECRLTGPADREAYLTQIARYARSNEDQPFLRGGGWLPDAFPDRGPSRQDLDAVVSDRPTLLKSMDGHSAWVNTAALTLAGIDRSTPDPPGGLIERDPASGEATGTLREWTAMELVEARLPAPTSRDRVMAGWAFLEQAHRLGLVSVHEAMAKEEELLAYQTLDREGNLTLQVQAALLCEPGKGLAQIEDLKDLRHTFQGGRLTPRAAKLFVDGVVEGHTAWLLAPYEDRPGFYGERLWEPKDLQQTAAALDRAGFQLHFHAVGDGAVRMALDAVAYTISLNGPRDRRPMIAHGDLISPDDLPRFCTLGVIANLQPLWFYEERNFRKTTLPFLGNERAGRMYTIRSLLNAGASVACGTDWPFSGELNTFDPLTSIQVGLTRRGLDPDAAPVYNPGECLSMAALINAHTCGVAFADFAEETSGSLTVGKSADLICLDRNLFALPPEDLFRARVLLTLFEGQPVYRALP